MFIQFLVIFGVYFGATEAQVTDLPPVFKPFACKKSNPDYAACVKHSFEVSWPTLIKGVKELNIPPLDPLELPHFKFDRVFDKLVTVHFEARNLRIEGINKTQIKSIVSNPARTKIQMHIYLPQIHASMEYMVKANLGGTPLKLQGFMDGNFTGVSIAPTLSVKKYKKNGEDYFAVDNFNLKVALGDGKIFLSGSTPDEQAAADFVTNMFNANPGLLVDSMSPVVIESTKDLMVDAINQFFSLLPAYVYQPE